MKVTDRIGIGIRGNNGIKFTFEDLKHYHYEKTGWGLHLLVVGIFYFTLLPKGRIVELVIE